MALKGAFPFYVAGLVRAMKRLFNWLVEEGELTASFPRGGLKRQPRGGLLRKA